MQCCRWLCSGKAGLKSSIVSVIALCVLLTPALGVSAPGDIVTDWNNQALDTIRQESVGTPAAARVYAMVSVAMYDAVNGIEVESGNSTRAHALVPTDNAPTNGSLEAAAAQAAHDVLVDLYPTRAATYAAQLATHLAALTGPQGPINQGVDWGEEVAEEVLHAREDDGSSPGETLSGGMNPGDFTTDFTSAQYRNMTPFAIADKLPYRSAGPPVLTSPEYLAAHHEVRLLGDDAYVNQEYEEIFSFWKGGGGSARPPGEWIKIAIEVAENLQTTDSLPATARLFALLGMALGDATITAWDSKFEHHFWRPRTAIREADTDGNPNTVDVDDWTPRNGGKGGSPEHTSGQSTYAGAGSTILAGFYCRDNITFTFEGDDALPAAGARTFNGFSDAAREAGRARIFAGIHFEFSNQAGQTAGRGVAREIMTSALLRSGGSFDPALDCAP